MPVRAAAVAAVLLLAGPGPAADLPVKVTNVRVGLPPGKPDGGPVARFASWAPVYADLELASPVAEPAELVVEAADPDEISTTFAVPLDLSAASGSVSAAALGTIGYVRPAGVGEVTVTVRAGGKPVSEPFRVRSLRPRDPLAYAVLTVGPPVPGFELPKPTGAADDPAAAFRYGRIDLASISDAALLPDRWFGYEGADLVVLNTGSEDFLRRLFTDPPSAKRDALVEWVRRGGRLVVTVGANADLVAKLPALHDLLPVAVTGARPAGVVSLTWPIRAGKTSTTTKVLGQKGATFPVAVLAARPGRPARQLIPPPDRPDAGKDLVAAQAAVGLGRVTVVGFDLDRPPFAEFAGRAEFWDWVLAEGGAARASAGGDGKPRPPAATLSEEEDEAAVALRAHADSFDGVPVVSFGWVAVLIVLYLLLIGPVEYFFLKRVLGRLELTWVSFPLIVLTVSLAAYFTAHSLKGRELRANKVDVVDVDAAGGRVYGTTWCTVFSPRIDTYTVGVGPNDGWGTAGPGTAVSWVGAPRGGRASLLRRSYSYHAGADALEKVPVQVWSTKSFGANWAGGFDPLGPAPAAKSELVHPPGDPSAVTGTFTLNLPVPVLSDCVLFYAGQAYPLPGGTVVPGEPVRPVWDKLTPAGPWLQKEGGLDELLRRAPGFADRPGVAKAAPAAPGAAAGPLPLLGVLFHEACLPFGDAVVARNASLRRLDQSWRLTPDNRGEVILVGRAFTPAGTPAEEALSGPAAGSRLWLRGRPGAGDRAPLPGTGRQETWVRVYLPVR